MTRVAVIVAVLTVAACKGKDKEKTPAAGPAPATTTDPTSPAADRARQRASRRLEPVSVEELGKVFAAPEGARSVTPAAQSKVGESVNMTLCFDKTDVAAAAEALRASLEKQGWSPVFVRARPESPDRAAVSAQQQPYRLSAAVARKTDMPDCAGANGHSYVSITVHKMSPRATLQPGQSGNGRVPLRQAPAPGGGADDE